MRGKKCTVLFGVSVGFAANKMEKNGKKFRSHFANFFAKFRIFSRNYMKRKMQKRSPFFVISYNFFAYRLKRNFAKKTSIFAFFASDMQKMRKFSRYDFSFLLQTLAFNHVNRKSAKSSFKSHSL